MLVLEGEAKVGRFTILDLRFTIGAVGLMDVQVVSIFQNLDFGREMNLENAYLCPVFNQNNMSQ